MNEVSLPKRTDRGGEVSQVEVGANASTLLECEETLRASRIARNGFRQKAIDKPQYSQPYQAIRAVDEPNARKHLNALFPMNDWVHPDGMPPPLPSLVAAHAHNPHAHTPAPPAHSHSPHAHNPHAHNPHAHSPGGYGYGRKLMDMSRGG